MFHEQNIQPCNDVDIKVTDRLLCLVSLRESALRLIPKPSFLIGTALSRLPLPQQEVAPHSASLS